MRTKIILIAFLLLVPFYLLQAQNGTQLLDFNARTLGRGGTSIGTFDSASLMMSNPAGISFVNKNLLDFNFSLMAPKLHFQNSLNNVDGKNNYYPLPSLAYLNNKKDSKFAWGFGLFTSGGMGADFTMENALFVDQSGNKTPMKYHSMLAVMEGGPTVSYKLMPELSIGATVHLVYSMMEFQSPYSLSPSIMKGVANPSTGMTFGQMFSAPATQGGFGYTEVTAAANMKNLSSLTFTGKIGLAYKPNDNLSFGLSYSMPTPLVYKNGTATMDMTAQLNDAFGKAVQGYMMQNPTSTPQEAQAAVMQQFTQLGIDMSAGVKATYDLEARFSLPQTIGFGMSAKAAENFRISLDAMWLNWANAFDKMELSLKNGNNANINKMLGNQGDFSVNFPLDWKNSVVIKVGGEYDINSNFTVQAGYAYGSNPVPNSTVFPVFPAIVENHIMAGIGYQVSTPLRINLALEHAINHKQTASSQSIVASEYNNSTSELSTSLLHLSLSYSF